MSKMSKMSKMSIQELEAKLAELEISRWDEHARVVEELNAAKKCISELKARKVFAWTAVAPDGTPVNFWRTEADAFLQGMPSVNRIVPVYLAQSVQSGPDPMTAGYVWSYACGLLDNGVDPRGFEVPIMFADCQADFLKRGV